MNYEVIVRYIELFESDPNYGKWCGGIADQKPGEPVTMPYVDYSKTVCDFLGDVSRYGLTDYNYLENHEKLENRPLDEYRVEDVFTELTFYIRGERFCDGVLLHAFNDGTILKLLKALKKRLDRDKEKAEI